MISYLSPYPPLPPSPCLLPSSLSPPSSFLLTLLFLPPSIPCSLPLRKVPNVLEYLSYNFSFLSLLAGPSCGYVHHLDFITGENMKLTADRNGYANVRKGEGGDNIRWLCTLCARAGCFLHRRRNTRTNPLLSFLLRPNSYLP